MKGCVDVIRTVAAQAVDPGVSGLGVLVWSSGNGAGGETAAGVRPSDFGSDRVW